MSRVAIGGTEYELPTRGLSVSQRRLIEAVVARVNAPLGADYAVVDPDTSDFVTAFNAAKAAAVAAGTNRVHFPDGAWTADCGGRTDSSALVTVPSNFQVTGAGWGRSIINVINESTGVGQDGVDVFRCVDGTTNVLFEGLHFKGTNRAPFTYVLNNQNSCIAVLLINSKDIVVRECKFEDLWGFTVHVPGEGERISCIDCHSVNTANGMNNNSNWSVQTGNVFSNAEGIEASGKYCVFANNTFKDALGVAISVGGNNGGGEYPGSVVANNTIEGSTGAGIVVTDGFVYGAITGNVVKECMHGGIILQTSGAGPLHSCVVALNNVDSNCEAGGSSVVGIDIQSGAGKHVIFGNRSTDSGVSGYSQLYGLKVATPSCQVFGNYLKGVNKDASFTTGATDTYENGNTYVNRNEEWVGTATRTPTRISVKSATDLVETVRVWNGSAGDDFSRFARLGDGTLKWGGASAVHDTNLYRSAADTLKTDDKFIAVAGIGVGNSAVASTPGTVVRRIQVFDASGNSLGYIAVYDAIT